MLINLDYTLIVCAQRNAHTHCSIGVFLVLPAVSKN
jgi:hypothetical protein